MEAVTIPKAPRPVLIAAIGQGASIVMGFAAYAALRPHPHLVSTIIVWSVLFVLLFFLFRALVRGANWVRWLLSIVIAIGILLLPGRVAAFSERWQASVYIAQAVVQAATVVLLFLPVSNRWFSNIVKA